MYLLGMIYVIHIHIHMYLQCSTIDTSFVRNIICLMCLPKYNSLAMAIQLHMFMLNDTL